MQLQQWSPNRTNHGITSEAEITWYQGLTSTKSKSIWPNKNRLKSYVDLYHSLRYGHLELFCTCRNNVGTSMFFITSTLPYLTRRRLHRGSTWQTQHEHPSSPWMYSTTFYIFNVNVKKKWVVFYRLNHVNTSFFHCTIPWLPKPGSTWPAV